MIRNFYNFKFILVLKGEKAKKDSPILRFKCSRIYRPSQRIKTFYSKHKTEDNEKLNNSVIGKKELKGINHTCPYCGYK